MFCMNCGHSLEENSTFCPECGFRQTQQKTQVQEQGQTQEFELQQNIPVQQEYELQQNALDQQQYVQAQQQYAAVQQPLTYRKSKKKRFGCLTVFLVLFGMIIVAALAAYVLLPGLARPYDLGVKSSETAYDSAIQKLGIVKDKAPSAQAPTDKAVSAQAALEGASSDAASLDKAAESYKIIYGSPQQVQTELNSEEITSFLNENRPDNYALHHVQIRVNDDNTVDATGTIDTSYVFDEILKGKYTREDARQAVPALGLLPDKVNFSCNIEGAIKDNKTEAFDINSISVMGIPIPDTLVNSQQTDSFISSALDSYLGGIADKSGASYDLIQANGGRLLFEGRLPSSITHVPAE